MNDRLIAELKTFAESYGGIPKREILKILSRHEAEMCETANPFNGTAIPTPANPVEPMSTPDLIAELAKRRPCKRCEFKLDEYCECCWYCRFNKFKEAR